MNRNFYFTKARYVLTTLALILSLCLTIPQKAHAYNTDQYRLTDDFYWIVDNNAIKPSDTMVVLNMLVQKDSRYETANWFYTFDCVDGVFEDGDEKWEQDVLKYNFNPLNKTVVGHTDSGEVWQWLFGIEQGTYSFSPIDGAESIYTLTSTFGSPFMQDGYEKPEERVVDGSDTVVLYALYGDREWAMQNVQVLIDWAKEREGMDNSQTEPTDIIKVENANETATDATTVDETQTLEDAEASSETIESAEIIQTTEDAQEDAQETKKSSKKMIIMIPFVILVCAALFYIKKKDENRKE